MHLLWTLVSTVLLAHLLPFCETREDANPDFFTAAVFEHRHRHDIETDSANEIKQKNLNFFEKAAEEASRKGADIVVFNEYGLFPYTTDRAELKQYAEHIPNPSDGEFNPCEDEDEFEDSLILVTLSCMAKKHNMYVVANMGDEQPCHSTSQTCDLDDMENCDMNDKCPEDGAFLYNANVAFDREGYLIARYHKLHPYFEVVNTPEVPEYTTFTTEFGVFGLIVCFDSFFKESVNLVEKYDVETMIFTTFWFDDISPFNAVEFQQAWALSNKVNFLAANIHKPGLGSLGSGIYSKYFGALKYSYSPDGQSKLLVAKVPRSRRGGEFPNEKTTEVTVISDEGIRNQDETGDSFQEYCYDKIIGSAIDDEVDYRCFKPKLAKYSLKKLEGSSGEFQECHNGMCCSVSYSAQSMEEDFYLAVFNGTNDAENFYFWCEETCLLVRCDAFENIPCVTLPARSDTVFLAVEMKASFTAERIFPAVSKTGNRLAPKSEWDFETAENRAILEFKSESGIPLLKAGFFGRCYARDPPFTPWY